MYYIEYSSFLCLFGNQGFVGILMFVYLKSKSKDDFVIIGVIIQ